MTLRDKLKALTAPSREVDAEIAVMFGARKEWVYDPTGGKGRRNISPHYTASLDATVELVERELPGWWWALERVGGEHWTYIGGDISCVEARRKHSLPAVALLLALVGAKEIE